jgi:hypothetical protein
MPILDRSELNQYRRVQKLNGLQAGKLNQTLYDLCRNNQDHTDKGWLFAKVGIIGRTYATGIERHVDTNGKLDSALTIIVNSLFRNRTGLQAIMNDLASIHEPLDVATIEFIVARHGRFIKLLNRVPGMRSPAPSFASKYMHFHCPAVPIYDSRANGELRRLLHGQQGDQSLKQHKKTNSPYSRFATFFLQLYEDLRADKYLARKGVLVDVKSLDAYLVYRADNRVSA